jgi:hypothetical protein
MQEGVASLSPADAVLRGRVERASMAISYVFLWRWQELREFAGNISYSWPLADTQEDAFNDFARIFNATGTKILTIGTQQNIGGGALTWLHGCVFGTDPTCAKGGGGGDGGAVYSEVVLDECATIDSNATSDCKNASVWTAAPADAPNGTMFTSGLSTAQKCYVLNVCDVAGSCDPVVAYGDATGKCSGVAIQNTFFISAADSAGLLRNTKGCVQAAAKDVAPNVTPLMIAVTKRSFLAIYV